MINSNIIMIKNIEVKNPLHDVDNYSSALTISKVVLFFERKEIIFTKTMIQNYIKIGLLPPPSDNRYYTKKHLMMLVLINLLKCVYSLDEINEAFKPYMKYFKDTEDLMFNNLYQKCLHIYNNTIKNILNESNIYKKESENNLNFDITIISLMLQSAALKKICQKSLNFKDQRI